MQHLLGPVTLLVSHLTRQTESKLDALPERAKELAETQNRAEKELAKLASENRKSREQPDG